MERLVLNKLCTSKKNYKCENCTLLLNIVWNCKKTLEDKVINEILIIKSILKIVKN